MSTMDHERNMKNKEEYKYLGGLACMEHSVYMYLPRLLRNAVTSKTIDLPFIIRLGPFHSLRIRKMCRALCRNLPSR